MSTKFGIARLFGLAVVVTSLALSTLGCSAQSLASIMPGVINDPANRTLRRELMSFATASLCTEMLKRSVGLKLRDEDPIIGRFYPRQCAVRELETGNLFIQFGGAGYAWSNLTKRIGFDASAGVEYDQDFRVHDGDLYVYFRPASVTAKKFDLRMAEQAGGTPLGPLVQIQNPQAFANQLGEGVMQQSIARGFTVIRDDDGSAWFSLGYLAPGERPPAPFTSKGSGKLLLANERIEIHQNQRDFAGPFEVPDDGMALFVTMNVEGAPGVDLLAFPRSQGEVWLESYSRVVATAGPPTPPMLDETVQAGAIYRRVIRLPRGQYYLVVDNTGTAGRSQPPSYGLDDRAAMVSLAVELDDAP